MRSQKFIVLFCVEVMSEWMGTEWERDQLKPPDRQLTLRRGKQHQKNIKKRGQIEKETGEGRCGESEGEKKASVCKP